MRSRSVDFDRHRVRRRMVALLAVSALVGGCAHGTISPAATRATSPLQGMVSEVYVKVGPLSPQRRALYDRLDANRAIGEAIAARLVNAGRWDEAGGLQLEVEITQFRLRSTSNVIWNGLFAGVDKLEGEVSVRKEDESADRYSFRLSGWEDGYFKYSSRARFRSLAKELAEKVSTLFEQPV